MEDKNIFNYRYTPNKNREVLRIREKYLPQAKNDLFILKKLDSQVKCAGIVPALVLGIIGCLIFGVGVCFSLDVLIGELWITATLLLLGSALMILAYPIFKIISSKTRNRLVPKILALSDKILSSTK